MKRNDWILTLAVFIYSYLFYEQSAGINFLIFNILLVGGLLLKDRTAARNPRWLAAAAGTLLTATCIFLYSSPLAIISNLVSLALLSALSISAGSSVLTSLFLSMCSVGASYVFMIIDWIERKKKRVSEKVSRPVYVTILVILIAFVVSLLFFLMYRASNPLFDDFTKHINLDFISIPWIAFTLGGLILLYGFFYNRPMGFITTMDNQPDALSQEKAAEKGLFGNLFKPETERLSGIILLVTLNIMLLTLNLLDLNYLWFDGTLPEGIKHKEFVHKGVGVLITSIVSAILLILFYFRGGLNYDSNNRFLKLLACAWIIQNAFMIFSTAYRNDMYIAESGLSYKKIGVYVYLLLAFIGLVTTYIKITRVKSNWFLFRKNAWAFYGILVISCVPNWDVIITGFNIQKAEEGKKLEKYLLADLSFKNIPQLLQLKDTVQEENDYDARDYYYSLRGVYFHDFKTGLHNKLFRFMKEMETNGWQSYCYEKERTYADIMALERGQKIPELNLAQYYSATTLSPVHSFSNLRTLDLSGNGLEDLSELSHFPHLSKLSLASNRIDSLEKLPVMAELKHLNLDGNHFRSLAPLKAVPALEELSLSNLNLRDLRSFPKLTELRSLSLASNPIYNFAPLAALNKLEELDISATFSGRPDSVPHLPALKKLTLSSNGIGLNNAAVFIEKIRHFEKLHYLDLSANSLENPYCLTQLYNQSAYLNSWEVDPAKGKVAPLFPSLKELHLSSNRLKTLAGLESYSALEVLSLNNNELKDLGPLASLKQLKTLSLSGNQVHDLQALAGLSGLEQLDMANCQIKSVAFADSLKKLRKLDVSGNFIDDGTAIFRLASLRELNLDNNQIADLKGIGALKDLEQLYLGKNDIADFTPLYQLKNLKKLRIDGIAKDKLKELKKALPDCKIEASLTTDF